MASKKQRASGTWDYKFTRKGLLDKPVYRTFDTEEEGDTFAAFVEAALDRGVVSPELLSSSIKTVGQLLSAYSASETLAHSAESLIPTLDNAIGKTLVASINNAWLDKWIEGMKAVLAPSTLKKRVELLARAVDWAMRKQAIPLSQNPMRLLPKGYAGKLSRELEWTGQRDRRLSEDGAEEKAIRSVLAEKGCPEEVMLFDMALETAMRMREMYTLTRDQVSLEKETIFLEKTKNGDKRQVPMSSVLKRLLEAYLPTLTGDKLFPWWDGERLDETYLNEVTNKLSQKFARRFALAKCPDLTFHDLRHEATSRIYERTTLSDLEIASITGHKDPRMLKRYANLRGSSLARKLWGFVFAAITLGCISFSDQAFVNITSI